MVSNTLSPKEMALLIGASESSLKRWIDSGKLDAHKTTGGHRRITVPEAIEFIRRNNLVIERPDLLGIKTDPGLAGFYLEGEKGAVFERYLVEGGQDEAFSLVFNEYLSGMSVQEICDSLFRPALEKIGRLWEEDTYGIVIEHRATDICVRILNQLRNFMALPSGSPIALGGAPTGDFTVLASLCVAISLEAEGIPVSNLGAHVPFDSLLQAVDRAHPRFVWLSINHVGDARSLEIDLQQFSRNLEERDLTLLLGGYGLSRVSIPDRQNVFTGRSISDLLSIIRQSHLIEDRP